MKSVLYRNPQIEVRKSSIHGYGVFALTNLPANIILEEVPFIVVPNGVATNYVFAFPRGGTPADDTVGMTQQKVLPFGYACIYNHADDANASWSTDVKRKLFVFFTIKDIQKDEEIRTYYGSDAYWTFYPSVKKV